MSASLLLLSGGQSRRMGQDKAELIIQDQSLIAWQAQRFKQAGFDVVQGVADNFDDFRGPLAGIEAALTRYPNIGFWIVVPVDMPMMSTSVLDTLIRVGRMTNRVTAYRHKPLPVYIPVCAEVTECLKQWLDDDNGKRSVYAFIRALNGVWLEPESQDESPFFNINTPDDWQVFLQGVHPQ